MGHMKEDAMPFTDRQVSALKPKSQRYEKMEPGRSGLGMRVTPRGQKVWTFRYRVNGEQKRMLFGSYPLMGVASAHKALADAKDKLAAGIDPGAEIAQERAIERNAETVAELADEYIERHCKPNLKPAGATEARQRLDREIIPILGKMRAKAVTRRDLILLLDGIEDRGTLVLRNRVSSLLSGMFRFGMDRGIIDASPATAIRRVNEGPGRERFLSMEEISAFWHGLDHINTIPQVKLALKFCLATGQRRGEVAGTSRDEIDDAEALWRLPGERTKNGKSNIIPLPALIKGLVEQADRHRVKPVPAKPNRKDRPAHDPEPSIFLFPSRSVGEPIQPATLSRALNLHRETLGIGDARVHDLRRTFTTWNSEIGTSPEILSSLLNHTPQSITGRVYDRSENIEPKRAAMERWCDWLALVIAGDFDAAKAMQGAKVVPMRASA